MAVQIGTVISHIRQTLIRHTLSFETNQHWFQPIFHDINGKTSDSTIHLQLKTDPKSRENLRMKPNKSLLVYRNYFYNGRLHLRQ